MWHSVCLADSCVEPTSKSIVEVFVPTGSANRTAADSYEHATVVQQQQATQTLIAFTFVACVVHTPRLRSLHLHKLCYMVTLRHRRDLILLVPCVLLSYCKGSLGATVTFTSICTHVPPANDMTRGSSFFSIFNTLVKRSVCLHIKALLTRDSRGPLRSRTVTP